jgi:hypothetical protein
MLVLSPLIYPLSMGPLAMVSKAFHRPEPLKQLEVIYEPLKSLPEPFVKALAWWVHFWRGFAP